MSGFFSKSHLWEVVVEASQSCKAMHGMACLLQDFKDAWILASPFLDSRALRFWMLASISVRYMPIAVEMSVS